VYATQNLGSPGGDSFSARVRRSFEALRVGSELQSELKALGMSERDAAEAAIQTLRSAEHAADALQVLRRAMGDTHGSRPALAAVAYNTVKMSVRDLRLAHGQGAVMRRRTATHASRQTPRSTRSFASSSDFSAVRHVCGAGWQPVTH
jgi:hypothetical protein